MQDYTDKLIEFIEQQPEWAAVIVALVAFLESLAFVGVLVPGWLILVGVGALVGSQILPFYSICLAMFIGAVIGEGLSYWLGYHYRDQIRHWGWIESHQKALERADRFVRRYGVLSLVIGRFVGPVRAVIPVVVGISGMKQSVFWWVNILSGLLWAPLYLFPGILLGAALALPEGSKELLSVALIALVIFLWLARMWWLQGKREENYQVILRAYLAMLCALIVFIAVSISPTGIAMWKIIYQALSVVA